MKKLNGKKATAEQKRRKSNKNLPNYCDFSCEHASFPEIDAVGACRREQAVYCTFFDRYNYKLGKCLSNSVK